MSKRLEDKFKELANEIRVKFPEYIEKINSENFGGVLELKDWIVIQDWIYELIEEEIKINKILFSSIIAKNLEVGFSQYRFRNYTKPFLSATYLAQVKKKSFLGGSLGDILKEAYPPFEIKISGRIKMKTEEIGEIYTRSNSIVLYSDLESFKKYIEANSTMVKKLEVNFI